MNRAEITPLILTFNEQENIARCLDHLQWAAQIVVVDKNSTDETPTLCARYANVRLLQGEFDSPAAQANFGIAGISTPWMLSLDADYIVPAALADELAALRPDDSLAGYYADFTYCVFGSPLRGTLYPPRQVLYRTSRAKYFDDGHAWRVRVEGKSGRLRQRILHDDRKPLSRWFASQARYARLEAEKLLNAKPEDLRTSDKIRRLRLLAPLANLLIVLFARGVLFDGPPGWYYAVQRLIAELMISACLLDHDLRKRMRP